MRSVYTVPIRSKVKVEDHWPVPFMNGTCRIIEDGGFATALEITFTGEPITNSPLVQKVDEGEVKMHITGRDNRVWFVKRHLEDAFAFLECYHNLELATDEITSRFEAESPEEAGQIDIHSFTTGRHKPAVPLAFDMLTRALMAAETQDGPHFQTKLVTAARDMLDEQRFIDSFRYSFLLIEAMYGEGKFKTKQLQDALKGNPDFVAMVERTIADPIKAKNDTQSTTAQLMAASPSASDVIDHLVSLRGHYFHGNVKRKDAWSAAEQEGAETLALLAALVAHEIVQEAAIPMFEPNLAERHFKNAIKAGAELMFEIRFEFQDGDEPFTRQGAMPIRTPGTKVTPRQANAIAREFMARFEQEAPNAAIRRASCHLQATGQKVFDLAFHVPQPAVPQAAPSTTA